MEMLLIKIYIEERRYVIDNIAGFVTSNYE